MNSLPVESPEVQDSLRRIACSFQQLSAEDAEDLFQELCLLYHRRAGVYGTQAIYKFCWMEARRWANTGKGHVAGRTVGGGAVSVDRFTMRNHRAQPSDYETKEAMMGRILGTVNPWPCLFAREFYKALRGVVSSGALAVLGLLHEGYTWREIETRLGHDRHWITRRIEELRAAVGTLQKELTP